MASLCPQRLLQVLDVSSSGPRFLKNPDHRLIIGGPTAFVQPRAGATAHSCTGQLGAYLHITDLFRLANRTSP
jgi:hypothetical protein